MKRYLCLLAPALLLAASGCSRQGPAAPKHPTVYQQVYGQGPPYVAELNAVKVRNKP